MPSSYTTSLRLTLPATGELSGQWGNTVNTGITELLDSAVAGTASISTWGGAGVAYTLSSTSGAADEARKMFIVASGSPGEAKNVICPAVSKFYVFRNDTTGGFALTLKTPSGTGISVPAGQYKFLYCDGTNVVEMFNSAGALSLSGNLTLSGGTANGVAYLNGSKVLTTGSALTFDGTTLTVSTAGNTALNLASSSTAAGDGAYIALTNAGYFARSGRLLGDTSNNLLISSRTTSAVVGNIVFGLGDSYTEGMRLTSTGLGIGTSSPAASCRLEVAGTNSTTLVRNSTTTAANGFNAFSTGGNFYFGIDSSAGNFYGAGAYGRAIYSDGAYPIAFYTNAAECMRLDSSGNLGLGVTPSASGTTYGGSQMRTLTVQSGNIVSAAGYDAFFTQNAYRLADGSWRYQGNGGNNVAHLYGQLTGGNHAWYTALSGTAGNPISFTQAMTLDASGNLGVGTTSPSTRLHVAGGSTTEVRVVSSGDITTGGAASLLRWGGSNSATSGYVGYGGTSSTIDLWNTLSGSITFGTNNTERARITSGGDLLVGTTSKLSGGISGFDINGASGAYGVTFGIAGAQKAFQFVNSATSAYTGETATGYTIQFVSGGSNGVSLANGGTSWGSLSDERRKDIIEPISDAAAKVFSLRAVIGKYKTDDEGTRRAFLIAQDVQAVLPEAVVENNGDLILQYTDTIPLLVAAIKEQQAIITDLRARVAALEGV